VKNIDDIVEEDGREKDRIKRGVQPALYVSQRSEPTQRLFPRAKAFWEMVATERITHRENLYNSTRRLILIYMQTACRDSYYRGFEAARGASPSRRRNG